MMNSMQRIRFGLLITSIKLDNVRLTRDAWKGEKDPNPDNWRTIGGADVHLKNGKIDGGAGGLFNGKEWTGSKPHRTNKEKEAPAKKGAPAPVSFKPIKGWTMKRGTKHFNDGYNTDKLPARKAVYYTKGNTSIVFPADLDSSNQTMTPEDMARIWDMVPDDAKFYAPAEIEVVDYANPMDEYWKKKYKNFPGTYTGSGKAITFFKHRGKHYDDYAAESICHEIGHNLDYEFGDVSSNKKWVNAILKDKEKTGTAYVSEYAENDTKEDFADSVMEYFMRKDEFAKKFPNRFKVIKSLLGGRKRGKRAL